MMGKAMAKEAEHHQLEAESLVEAARERYNGDKATVTSSRESERRMPTQVYRCPEHGEFEVERPINEDVPKFRFCMEDTINNGQPWHCLRRSKWVPSVPNFIGGPTTGAKEE